MLVYVIADQKYNSEVNRTIKSDIDLMLLFKNMYSNYVYLRSCRNLRDKMSKL